MSIESAVVSLSAPYNYFLLPFLSLPLPPSPSSKPTAADTPQGQKKKQLGKRARPAPSKRGAVKKKAGSSRGTRPKKSRPEVEEIIRVMSCCNVLLVVVGSCWFCWFCWFLLVVVVGFCWWLLLVLVGSCWFLLVVLVGSCWFLLLVFVGSCWLLLVLVVSAACGPLLRKLTRP